MDLYPPPVCRGVVQVTNDVTVGKGDTIVVYVEPQI